MAHDGTPLHVPMLGSSPAGQPQGTPTCRAGTCRVFSDHGFLSEITSFWVFRTYLQGLKKKLNIFRYICQGYNNRINGCIARYARATHKCIHSCTEQMYTHISDNGLIVYTQFRSCTEQMYTQLYCF